jgi:phospholipase/carboxylesterase
VPTATEPELLAFKGWPFRLQASHTELGRLLILLHGWMGDENSMWMLARRMSPDYTILAPRGLFPVAEGGYSWRQIIPGTWGMASLEELRPSAEALLAFVDDWSTSAGINSGQFDLMGFSQGAAMAYTLAFLYPQQVRRLAALSGFIPEAGEAVLATQQFSGKPVFIAHGRQDKLIPVEQARRAAMLLKVAGAQVTYCESDAGHKVGKDCLRGMEIFLGTF